MALITCPECGRQISDKAPACIGCGFPISEIKASVKTETVLDPGKQTLSRKKIKCVVCGTRYSLRDNCCPKCNYPAFSFSSKTNNKRGIIRAYKKSVGLEEPKPTRITQANTNGPKIITHQAESIAPVAAKGLEKSKWESLIGVRFSFGMLDYCKITWVCVDARGDDLLFVSERCLKTGNYEEALEVCRQISQSNAKTNNKCFLLTREEAAKYSKLLNKNEAENGILDNLNNVGWWLESNGSLGWYYPKKGTSSRSCSTGQSDIGIRPAIWLGIEAWTDFAEMIVPEVKQSKVSNIAAHQEKPKQARESKRAPGDDSESIGLIEGFLFILGAIFVLLKFLIYFVLGTAIIGGIAYFIIAGGATLLGFGETEFVKDGYLAAKIGFSIGFFIMLINTFKKSKET